MTDDVEQKFQRFLGLTEVGKSERSKVPVPPSDGRRLRMTGRVAQLNLKVKPETKKRMMELADARGITMGALLEDLLKQSLTGNPEV